MCEGIMGLPTIWTHVKGSVGGTSVESPRKGPTSMILASDSVAFVVGLVQQRSRVFVEILPLNRNLRSKSGLI